jgi:hypothetical protein
VRDVLVVKEPVKPSAGAGVRLQRVGRRQVRVAGPKQLVGSRTPGRKPGPPAHFKR